KESSEGLPQSGSWRNSLSVADMNGDGCPDIVAPPERGVPNGTPSIFLGDCKGHWTFWKDVNWPPTLDYGRVVAADRDTAGNIAAPDQYFGGDWLATGNFNGDKYPDFVGASVYYNGPNILYMSDGPKKFNLVSGNGKLIPYYSYHYANAAGHFSSKKLDDAII